MLDKKVDIKKEDSGILGLVDGEGGYLEFYDDGTYKLTGLPENPNFKDKIKLIKNCIKKKIKKRI